MNKNTFVLERESILEYSIDTSNWTLIEGFHEKFWNI